MRVSGGYSYYGFKIGMLVLDSSIPRIPGDLGNATTFDFPVVYKTVKGASIARVIGETDPELLKPFIDAARELEAEGCKAIATSCGFLAIFQKEIAAAVNIPVFTSSLMQVGYVSTLLGPNKKVGVLTAEKNKLTERHLKGARIENVPMVVAGLDDSCFVKASHSEDTSFDPEIMEQEMVKAATDLVASDDSIGAIVLECTNMPPYAKAVQTATGLPVFDVVTFINYLYNALNARGFDGYM